MRGLLFLGAVMGIAGLTTPAHAAPVEQLSCIYDNVPPTIRAFAAEGVIAEFSNRSDPFDETINAEIVASLQKAGTDCMERYHWTETDFGNASGYFNALIVRDFLRVDPELSDVNFAILDAYKEKLPRKGAAKKAQLNSLANIFIEGSENDATFAKQYLYLLSLAEARKNEAAFVAGRPALGVGEF